MVGNYGAKIATLWTSFLLGTLFHTDLALMPLFHDLPLQHSEAPGNVNNIFGFMLLFFLIPMVAIVLPTFTAARVYRQFHFGLTMVYTIFNLAHLIADIAVKAPWYQLILMAILFVIGLVLNLVSYQWMNQEKRQRDRS
jgi:hypothetical protein